MALILAVDDSVTIREMMKVILSNAGHQVVTAEDGQEALEEAQKRNFDMFFCDVNMPKMSGITLVGKLRELPQYEHTPMIMVTTEYEEYRKKIAKRKGATGWLEKPVTEERLLKAVNKLVG